MQMKHAVMKTEITMYTDGSSRGNPGPGGYGVILMSGKHRKELAQGFQHTTNNRMELMAVIAGLQALKKKRIAYYSLLRQPICCKSHQRRMVTKMAGYKF